MEDEISPPENRVRKRPFVLFRIVQWTIAVFAVALAPASAQSSVGWSFNLNEKNCTATLVSPNGTSLSIRREVSEPDLITFLIINPSWNLEAGTTKRLSIRYTSLPFRDRLGKLQPAIDFQEPPTAVEAEVAQGRVGGVERSVLLFSVNRKTFDTYVNGADVGLRVSIYYEETALTGWVRIDGLVSTKLNGCLDPFK